MTGFVVYAALAGSGATQPLPGSSNTAQPEQANFGLEPASVTAHQMADWVVQSGDHEGRPFVLVDKPHARVFVFNGAGHLQGAAAALLGLAQGDDALAGLGNRPMSLILPHERTTPAGRFVATLARNVSGQDILWVDYEQGISLHPVRSVDQSERRRERLASPTVQDNRISYGCINVPEGFFRKVVVPIFTGTHGMVYVLPESQPLQSVFPSYKLTK